MIYIFVGFFEASTLFYMNGLEFLESPQCKHRCVTQQFGHSPAFLPGWTSESDLHKRS